MVWVKEILKCNDLELILVPGIGGRLMDVKYKGVSLLFQNPDLLSYQPDLTRLHELPTRATHLSFPLWGGEKTWIAPDADWPDGAPHSYLDSGQYTFQRHQSLCASMLSPVCPQSKLQISRMIELRDSGNWTIRHKVINMGEKPRLTGIWSVMMTQTPASYFFRTIVGATPKVVFGEPGEAYSCHNGVGQITCDVQQEFKLGIHPESGMTAARIQTNIGALWLVNRGKIMEQPEHYAHGHALEFYNSGHYDYGELEWHSPAVQLQPEQAVEFELDYQLLLEDKACSTDKMFKMIEDRQGNSA